MGATASQDWSSCCEEDVYSSALQKEALSGPASQESHFLFYYVLHIV